MAKTPRFKIRTAVLAAMAAAAAFNPMATAAAAAARLANWLQQPGADKAGVLGANTLTGLIPALYEALDVVSRELTGFIPAVARDSRAERAALNQSVTVPITPTASTANNTPGVTAPDTGDQNIDNVSITISKSKHVPVRWNGEETLGLTNAGTFSSIQAQRFYQGFRALANEMEQDLWLEAYKNASRAYGTAGTTPFGTANDLSDFAGVRRILEENGAPVSDLQLVNGHAAMANLRGKQSGLFKVNEAGSSDMLRNGMTERVMGMALRASNAINVHTKGTGTSYQTNLVAGYAIGDTSLALDTGSGTVVAGDVVTFTGDTNKYVNASPLTAGSIVLARPGLRATLADNVAMTIGNNYTPNVAFDRSAIVLATRAPALPEGGDSADDAMMITDPVTGLTFEIAVYRQYLQVVYHVRLAWGFKAVKQAHIATLLG